MTNAQSSLDDQRGEEARHLVRDLFNCNYDEKSKGRQFLDFTGNKSIFFNHTFTFSSFFAENGYDWIVLHNMRLRLFCEAAVDGGNRLCFDPNFVKTLCHLHPIQLIKTVRMRTKQLSPLLVTDPGIKIIVLLRDPRAVRSSRNKLPWCNFAACNHPKVEFYHISLNNSYPIVVSL